VWVPEAEKAIVRHLRATKERRVLDPWKIRVNIGTAASTDDSRAAAGSEPVWIERSEGVEMRKCDRERVHVTGGSRSGRKSAAEALTAGAVRGR
jgi:hypothetical protein